MTRLRAVLEIFALLLTIIVCSAILYVIAKGRGTPASPPASARASAERRAAKDPDGAIPSDPEPLDGAQIEGDPAAKVAIIEYSDFQCPYCAHFANQTLPALEKEYVLSGKVLFVFRHFPLESIHPFALTAAEAAECAGDQGRFWKMHALTFLDQAHLDDAMLRERAIDAGLDLEQFDACLQGDVSRRVRADMQAGHRMLVTGTPTFFVGMVRPDGRVRLVKRLTGSVPFERFKAVIDGVMSTSGAPRKTN